MKQREYTFKKKRSNTESLQNLLVIISLMISVAFAISFLLEIKYVDNLNQLSTLFGNSVIFGFMMTFSIIYIFVICLYLRSPWWYELFCWRLNTLFENVGKNETLSKKLVYPIVKMSENKNDEIFLIKFIWQASMTKSIQNEIKEHLLEELLFPSKDYVIEEIIETTTDTTFIFQKKAKRLVINYEQ
ncbi:hypothetical protein ACWN8B_05745 [Vagococcus zengguangii]|uniref:Uncharacterized protein n=1 Tax=Vagococcus zengguangii TaxID=2571750 RepID=A0A4D7CX11_9ENTE|nr:hypothetical protein [Vagococcus zengguangii]QCI86901.1 hypothetical protein FA707_07935 [Vagococcus zengguangii]